MKTKTKLAGIVIAFMLALSAMVVGIWAVSTATVNLGGNISFTANDVYAKITGKIEGAEDGTITFDELEYSATDEPKGDLSSWQQNRSLNFADKNTDIKITITIENLSSERSLDVIIKDTIEETQTNLKKSVSFKNGSETEATSGVLETKYTIQKGESAKYTITLKIANKNNSVDAEYGYKLALYDENYVDATPGIKVISNNETLGSASGGTEEVNDGEEITLTASAKEGKTFLGWAVEKNGAKTASNEEMTISAQATDTMPNISNMRVVSTDSSYTFTYSADRPTKYYALFNETIEENVTSGDLKYTIYKEAKLATLTDGRSVSGALEISPTVTINGIDYLVYVIGDASFYNNNNINSVIIPDSVTRIGNEAFSVCGGLTSSTIPNSVVSIGDQAFNSCSGLTSIIIGSSVANIGFNAFYGCFKLVEVYNLSSLEIIGYISYALDIYKSLDEKSKLSNENGYIFYKDISKHYLVGYDGTETNLTLPTKTDSYEIYKYAFYYCSELTTITIPESVTSIGDEAFYYCSELTTITIPESVTSIGDKAFYYCSELTTITIPESVTSIGSSAFSYCSGLIEINWNAKSVADFSSSSDVFHNAGANGTGINVTIGDNVTKIPAYTFESCSKLTSVTIGKSVTSIGERSFYYCEGLASLTIPDSVTSIGERSFYYCEGLASLTIPDSVTSIGSSAFYGCAKLIEINWNAKSVADFSNSSDVFYNAGRNGTGINVTFGDNVTNIPAYTFESCSKLTSVTIGNNVKTIGESAFCMCQGLTSLTIGSSVETISESAFSLCSKLESVIIPMSVKTIEYTAFANCSKLKSVTIDSETVANQYINISSMTGLGDNLEKVYIQKDLILTTNSDLTNTTYFTVGTSDKTGYVLYEKVQ